MQNNGEMTTPDALTGRMDALAAALRDAGVDADRIAGVLGSAARATLNALLLDAVVEESLHAAPAASVAELPAVERVEQPLRAAA